MESRKCLKRGKSTSISRLAMVIGAFQQENRGHCCSCFNSINTARATAPPATQAGEVRKLRADEIVEECAQFEEAWFNEYGGDVWSADAMREKLKGTFELAASAAPTPEPTGADEIRTAVANYMDSEGCSCCSDYTAHKEHKAVLARLLNVPAYDDGSGYDFGKFRAAQRQKGSASEQNTR